MTRFWENGSGHAGRCPHMRKMLKLLSQEVSMEVLLQLAERPSEVCRVANDLELEASVISRMLKQMHNYSMVEVKREQCRHIYSLSKGIDIRLNGNSVHVRAKTADGGEVALTIPRPPHSPRKSG